MVLVSSAWDLAVLFVPLVYAVILGPRDKPAQRTVALVESVAECLKAIEAIVRRLRK
ncbi:Uncharacterised protein [Mycobacteroides abscessus subsp. massiliense]|nr:Uncharacterised protein [Mycobacteroides abscessus subsp. massiliense]SLD38097.1 Uncharacterised protein [Mycobacteroides abscessus subsp. massiliense]